MMRTVSRTTINPCLLKSTPGCVCWFDVFFSIGCSFFLTWFVFSLNPLNAESPVEQYLLFAKNPFSFREMPYGARMATPVLVGLLPFDLDTGFRIVAFVSYFLCGSLLVLWLRLAGVSLSWSLLLLPAFYFASTAQFIAANAWYIDPMSYWILTAAFIAIMTGHFGLTMAFFAFGVLNRPESLTILPVLVIAWWRKDRPFHSLLQAGLCALPAVILALSMRYIWPLVSDFQVWKQIAGDAVRNDPNPYSRIFAQQGFKALIDPQIYRETLPYLWGLALVGMFQTSIRVRLMMAVWSILAILPMILATDYFRLPFYVFPAMIFLSGLGLQELQRIHMAVAGSAAAAVLLLTFFAPQSCFWGLLLMIGIVVIYWVLKQPLTQQQIEPSAPGR